MFKRNERDESAMIQWHTETEMEGGGGGGIRELWVSQNA